METLISEFTIWIRQEPGLFVGITLALPLLIGILLERVFRGRGAATTPEAETPAAPEAEIEPGLPEQPPAAPVSTEPPISAEQVPPSEPAPPEAALEPVVPPEPPPVVPGEDVAPLPPEPEPEPEPEPPAPVRLRDRLKRTSDALIGRLGGVLGAGRAVDEEVLEELEEILFTADLGVSTAESLLSRVRSEARGA